MATLISPITEGFERINISRIDTTTKTIVENGVSRVVNKNLYEHLTNEDDGLLTYAFKTRKNGSISFTVEDSLFNDSELSIPIKPSDIVVSYIQADDTEIPTSDYVNMSVTNVVTTDNKSFVVYVELLNYINYHNLKSAKFKVNGFNSTGAVYLELLRNIDPWEGKPDQTFLFQDTTIDNKPFIIRNDLTDNVNHTCTIEVEFLNAIGQPSEGLIVNGLPTATCTIFIEVINRFDINYNPNENQKILFTLPASSQNSINDNSWLGYAIDGVESIVGNSFTVATPIGQTIYDFVNNFKQTIPDDGCYWCLNKISNSPQYNFNTSENFFDINGNLLLIPDNYFDSYLEKHTPSGSDLIKYPPINHDNQTAKFWLDIDKTIPIRQSDVRLLNTPSVGGKWFDIIRTDALNIGRNACDYFFVRFTNTVINNLETLQNEYVEYGLDFYNENAELIKLRYKVQLKFLLRTKRLSYISNLGYDVTIRVEKDIALERKLNSGIGENPTKYRHAVRIFGSEAPGVSGIIDYLTQSPYNKNKYIKNLFIDKIKYDRAKYQISNLELLGPFTDFSKPFSFNKIDKYYLLCFDVALTGEDRLIEFMVIEHNKTSPFIGYIENSFLVESNYYFEKTFYNKSINITNALYNSLTSDGIELTINTSVYKADQFITPDGKKTKQFSDIFTFSSNASQELLNSIFVVVNRIDDIKSGTVTYSLLFNHNTPTGADDTAIITINTIKLVKVLNETDDIIEEITLPNPESLSFSKVYFRPALTFHSQVITSDVNTSNLDKGSETILRIKPLGSNLINSTEIDIYSGDTYNANPTGVENVNYLNLFNITYNANTLTVFGPSSIERLKKEIIDVNQPPVIDKRTHELVLKDNDFTGAELVANAEKIIGTGCSLGELKPRYIDESIPVATPYSSAPLKIKYIGTDTINDLATIESTQILVNLRVLDGGYLYKDTFTGDEVHVSYTRSKDTNNTDKVNYKYNVKSNIITNGIFDIENSEGAIVPTTIKSNILFNINISNIQLKVKDFLFDDTVTPHVYKPMGTISNIVVNRNTSGENYREESIYCNNYNVDFSITPSAEYKSKNPTVTDFTTVDFIDDSNSVIGTELLNKSIGNITLKGAYTPPVANIPTVTVNCTLKANAYSYLRPTDISPSSNGFITVTFDAPITKANGNVLDKDNFEFICSNEFDNKAFDILSITQESPTVYKVKFTGLDQDFRVYQRVGVTINLKNAFNAGLPLDTLTIPNTGIFTDYFDTHMRHGTGFDGIIRVKNTSNTGIVFEYNGLVETTYVIEPEDIIFDSNRDIQFTNTLAYPINTDTTIGTITSTYTNKKYSEVYGIKAKLTLNTGEKVELAGNTLVKISSDEQSEPALWITVKKKLTDINQHGNISIEFTSPVSKSNGGGDIDYTNFVFSGLDPNTKISAGPASGNNRIVNIKVSQLNEYIDPLNPDSDIVISTTGINLAFSGGNGGTYGNINGPIIIKYRDLFDLTTTPPLERVTVNVSIFRIDKANAYQAIDTIPDKSAYTAEVTSSEGCIVIIFDKPINKLDGNPLDSSNFEFTGITGLDNNGIRIIDCLELNEGGSGAAYAVYFSGYNQDFRNYINNPLTLTLKDVMSGNAPVLLDYNNNSNVKLYSDYFSAIKPTDYVVTINNTLTKPNLGEICFRVSLPGVMDTEVNPPTLIKAAHEFTLDNVVLTNSNNNTFTIKSLNKDKFKINTLNDTYFEIIVKENVVANTDITNIVINGKYVTGEDLVIDRPITYSINNTILSATMTVNDKLSPYISTDTGEFIISTTLPISSIDDTPVTFNNFEFSKTSDDKEWFIVQSFNAMDTQNFKFVIKYIKHNNLTANYNEVITITIKDIKVINNTSP